MSFVHLASLIYIYFSGFQLSKTDDVIRLPFKDIITAIKPFSKPEPISSNEQYASIHYSGIFISDDQKRVWYFNESEAWFFSLIDKTWTKYAEINGIEEKDYVVFNPLAEQFIFWSSDGGSISIWSPNKKDLNLENYTSDQKIFRQHVGFIDPNSGKIYAFGGRGYGVDSGLLWALNMQNMEWEIVNIRTSSQQPPGRIYASTIVSDSDRTFHLFGGISYKEGRSDISKTNIELWDYWMYDLDLSQWSPKKIFGLSDDSYHTKPGGTYRHRYIKGVVDQKNEMLWFHYKGMEDVFHSLIVYDIRLEHGIHLPISLFDNVNKPILRHFSLDPITNELIVFWTPWVSEQNQSVVNVSMTKLPDPNHIRSHIQEAKVHDLKTLNRDQGSLIPVSMTQAFLLVLTLGFISVFAFMYMRKIKTDNNQQPKERVPNLQLKISKTTTIYVNEIALDMYLTNKDLNVLAWMSIKHKNGDPFQSTDKIEAFFFSDLNDSDISRKQRNMSLKKINEVLSKLYSGYVHRDSWIIMRNAADDKRKKEYAIDLEGVDIRVDLHKNEDDIHNNPLNTEAWMLDLLEDISSHG
jgi:hypothetical protein